LDLSSITSGLIAGLNSIGRKNYAEEVTVTEIHGGEKGNGFCAGFSQKIILPQDYKTTKYYLAGYHENTVAEGLLDPQTVNAMYLTDGTAGNGHLFLSIDAVGLLNKDVQHIRDELKVFCLQAGICEISIFCTHDHAGIDTMGLWGRLPKSGKNRKFMSLLFSACYTASIEAYKNRRSGKLYYGAVSVPDMQEDVRTPEVYSDILTRLRFVPDNGENDIWLVNFAAHAESLQGSNKFISADFPCYFRRKIKNETDADVLYANGALGGMITIKIENEEQLRKENRLFEATFSIGEKLADYALSIENEKEIKPQILHARKEFYIPVENMVLAIASNMGIINVDRFDMPYSDEKAIKTELNYWEIGGLKILGVPGELFPELVWGEYLDNENSATGEGDEINPLPLAQLCSDESIIIFGLCNDAIGYIIPPNDFMLNENAPYSEKATDRFGRRHYEETNSVGKGTAHYLADAFSVILNDIRNHKSED